MYTQLVWRSLARLLVVAAFLIVFTSVVVKADTDGSGSAYNPLVRVHLARAFDGASTLIVSDTSPLEVTVWWSGKARPQALAKAIPAGATLTIEALASGTAVQKPSDIIAEGLCSLQDGESLTLAPLESGDDAGIAAIQRDKSKARHYRGLLQISAHSNGTLSVVNTLSLDDYLKGVVGPEIGSSAPLEAIKAQAIAARTYAVKNFGKCVQDGGSADLDDTTRCQNYLGYDAESWRCRAAVALTAGKIITFDGMPIDAVYSTDSGGVTAEGNEPYLKSVSDAGCANEAPWMVSLPLSDLAASLRKINLPDIRSLKSVVISSRDASGRADTVLLTDADGKHYTVPAIQLRKAIGYDKLRSTLFEIKIDRLENCTFTGRGWGHGLGMCQNGAIAMARIGAATCDQIIYHYYSGVEISDLTSDFLQADSDTSRDTGYVAQGS